MVNALIFTLNSPFTTYHSQLKNYVTHIPTNCMGRTLVIGP
jgi:hypothetical protein